MAGIGARGSEAKLKQVDREILRRSAREANALGITLQVEFGGLTVGNILG